jgi:hypothetical protein
VGDERFCQQVVQDTVRALGSLDIPVNSAAEEHQEESLDRMSAFAYMIYRRGRS